ncbi:MAG: hypothetical protein DME66_06980 [Verrucomicrobia bacterium]|nr:MAG: hypothetical protein DME66_06980 [Verrucomicrobiota bacterium]
MTGSEPQEQGKRRLRPNHRHGKQEQGSGVCDERKHAGQAQDGKQVREENSARQRHKVYVVATIEKDRIPAPQSGRSGYHQGENYEEVFVWNRGGEGIEGPLATQKPNQRAVLFKHQQRNQQARHGQENQDYAYANVKLSRFRVTAAAKHAAGKKSNEAAEGRSAKGAAPSFEPLPGPRNHEQATTSTM